MLRVRLRTKLQIIEGPLSDFYHRPIRPACNLNFRADRVCLHTVVHAFCEIDDSNISGSRELYHVSVATGIEPRLGIFVIELKINNSGPVNGAEEVIFSVEIAPEDRVVRGFGLICVEDEVLHGE